MYLVNKIYDSLTCYFFVHKMCGILFFVSVHLVTIRNFFCYLLITNYPYPIKIRDKFLKTHFEIGKWGGGWWLSFYKKTGSGLTLASMFPCSFGLYQKGESPGLVSLSHLLTSHWEDYHHHWFFVWFETSMCYQHSTTLLGTILQNIDHA